MRQSSRLIGNPLEFGLMVEGERFKVVTLAKWRDGADKVTISTLFGYASEL